MENRSGTVVINEIYTSDCSERNPLSKGIRAKTQRGDSKEKESKTPSRCHRETGVVITLRAGVGIYSWRNPRRSVSRSRDPLVKRRHQLQLHLEKCTVRSFQVFHSADDSRCLCRRVNI